MDRLFTGGACTGDVGRFLRCFTFGHVRQGIADLMDSALAHVPSGRFTANAACLVCAAMTFNLTRAVGVLASTFHAKARTATIRAQLITVRRSPETWPVHPDSRRGRHLSITTSGAGGASCQPSGHHQRHQLRQQDLDDHAELERLGQRPVRARRPRSGPLRRLPSRRA